jgi:DNA polymerase-3 subunit chi
VLINLAGSVPEFFSRYQRVAELVDGNEQRRTQGRERFRFYRDKGCELHTHQL